MKTSKVKIIPSHVKHGHSPSRALLSLTRLLAANRAKASKSDLRSRNGTVGLEIETSALQFETYMYRYMCDILGLSYITGRNGLS